MLLCASHYSVEGIRFLDDEELLKQFDKLPHALVRPEIQRRLEAIRRVQQAKREWIFTGLARGEFQLRGNKLAMPDSYGAWPANFVEGQRLDPVFVRNLREAGKDGYTGKVVDLALRPEIAAWRKARAGTSKNQALMRYIIDEWMRTTEHADREATFRHMSYSEAEQLRRTEGLASDAYRAQFYRKDGENDRTFANRRSIAQRNDRQRGR